eukprot:CAMPEP_0194547422 /NCGR_PEP_ID=MMETSP0253-20130528/92126_1 /TAXON_ID=2966 /ORGANISM="Noctiluca scintillans" /LENGTH=107 /DNA_ID=CAMNT_0039394625 /DNA_START=92 /DNA_END=412 /DNA_ORIENTATION=+
MILLVSIIEGCRLCADDVENRRSTFPKIVTSRQHVLQDLDLFRHSFHVFFSGATLHMSQVVGPHDDSFVGQLRVVWQDDSDTDGTAISHVGTVDLGLTLKEVRVAHP